jgi:hypothetical protein
MIGADRTADHFLDLLVARSATGAGTAFVSDVVEGTCAGFDHLLDRSVTHASADTDDHLPEIEI